MAVLTESKPTRSFWIVASLALVWNALGIVTYLMSVTMSAETLASMSEAERALYTDIPVWVTGAYAVAVFGGTVASIALLLRKAWAVPTFVVSLVAIVIQMSHALFMSALIEVQGAGAAVFPVVIVVVAAFLVWYSMSAKKKGWIA
jgi:hypothetical protein